jgi:hypothetical protein
MINFILSVLGIVIAALIADQANTSAPYVARWLTRFAAGRLPEGLRARYEEEWTGVLNDVPGGLWKLWTAIGFVCAAIPLLSTAHKAKLATTAFMPSMRNALRVFVDILDSRKLTFAMLLITAGSGFAAVLSGKALPDLLSQIAKMFGQ